MFMRRLIRDMGALITEKMQKNVKSHGEKRSFLNVKM